MKSSRCGQVDGEVFGVDCADAAGWFAGAVELVEDREGLAPETLAGEEPIAELVVDGFLAEAGGGEIGGDLFFEFRRGKAIVLAGIDGAAVAGEAFLTAEDCCDRRRQLVGSTTVTMSRLNCLCEFEVALVVGGDGHDGAGAVADEHVVGDPDRDRTPLTGLWA